MQMTERYLSDLSAIAMYARRKYPDIHYTDPRMNRQRSNELHAIEVLIGKCNTYTDEDPIVITWDLIFYTHYLIKVCKKRHRKMFYDQLHVYIDIYRLLKEVNGL